MRVFEEWWREEQLPVVLATASTEGRPAARTVVLEHFDDRGFVFWTSSESRKGKELGANPRAALVFLWERRRQLASRAASSACRRRRTRLTGAGVRASGRSLRSAEARRSRTGTSPRSS